MVVHHIRIELPSLLDKEISSILREQIAMEGYQPRAFMNQKLQIEHKETFCITAQHTN